jgi:hydrogenase maturation protease
VISAEPPDDIAPILIFSYGNQSRGDDGLGPAIFELLDNHKQEISSLNNASMDRVDLLTDYQLQIEHAVDLEHRKCVLFIDADVACSAPYEFHRLQAQRDDSYTTHAMSPVSVLDVFRQINQCDPPPAYLLTVRGYEFGLGQAMTEQANTNLQHAFAFVKRLLATDIDQWSDSCLNA